MSPVLLRLGGYWRHSMASKFHRSQHHVVPIKWVATIISNNHRFISTKYNWFDWYASWCGATLTIVWCNRSLSAPRNIMNVSQNSHWNSRQSVVLDLLELKKCYSLYQKSTNAPPRRRPSLQGSRPLGYLSLPTEKSENASAWCSMQFKSHQAHSSLTILTPWDVDGSIISLLLDAVCKLMSAVG